MRLEKIINVEYIYIYIYIYILDRVNIGTHTTYSIRIITLPYMVMSHQL